MKRTLLGACAALCLAMVPAVVAGQETAPTGPAPGIADRLSQDRMGELVAGPMAIVRRDGITAGKVAFERLLAAARAEHGARSVEVADFLTAFAVGLYTFGLDEGDQGIRAASLPYLEAAIQAYRAAFGDAHPEVAVALTSYADVQSALNEDNPPQSADAAREEAYRISLSALGPTNLDTLASLRYLARLRGHPSRTRGEPARIEAAAVLFRQLISRSPDQVLPEYLSAPAARTAFARMYAQNRMEAEAMEQLRLAAEQAASWPPEDRCLFIAGATAEVERILDGDAAATRDGPLPGLGGQSECFPPEDEGRAPPAR